MTCLEIGYHITTKDVLMAILRDSQIHLAILVYKGYTAA